MSTRRRNRKDLVTHRGTISGSGKALPDEEALRILNERVEPPASAPVPEIGVVIDPSDSETTAAPSFEAIPAKWTKGFRRTDRPPVRIVKAESLQTPLFTVLDRSYGYKTPKGAYWAGHFGKEVSLRLLLEDAEIDVTVPVDQVIRGLTVFDAMSQAGYRLRSYER